MLYTIVGMLVIIIDQLVKFWVDRNINWTNPVRAVLPDVLSLVRVQNDGAAFSFLSGSGARVWFIVITAVFAVLVVLALATNFVSGKFGRWCLVFVTAGGLANMIDRVRYGYVIDMFKVELFDFAVFNVADIFITVFAIAFIIYILFGGEKEKDEYADEFDDEDYEEEDRPVRKPVKATRRRTDDEEDYPPARPSRKASRAYDPYDDEEDPEEEQPRRRTERSVAAAANAYSRQRDSYGSESSPARRTAAAKQPARQVPEEAPAARRRQSRPAEDEAAETRLSSRRRADDSIEKMFAAQETPRRAAVSERKSAESVRSANTKPAAERRSVPAYDPNNPFAEWEQANQRVSSRQTFNTYSEEPARSESGKASAHSRASESDDLDIDAILNEFK